MSGLARPFGAKPAVLLTLLAALCVTGPAAGDEPRLPPGTATRADLPPYRPLVFDGSRGLQAWCAGCVARGRSALGTRRGGDLLFSAAHVHDAYRHDLRAAATVYAQAVEAYPSADVSRAAVLVHWLRLESGRGHAPQAARLLQRLERWTRLGLPRDADDREMRRWRVWQRMQQDDLPRLQADHDEREGRLGLAAERLERVVRSRGAGLSASERARLLGRAARLHYRRGARGDAVRAMTSAAHLGLDEPARARMQLWSLYARHGLLDAHAAPHVDDRWPGAEFERDLQACLRALDGLEGAGTTYLALASRAYAARRHETALAIYRRALSDTTLVERARGDPSLWRGLLLGYDAALELGNAEEAERILEAVERIADEPIPEKDAYMLAIRRARARTESAAEEAAVGPPRTSGTTAPPETGSRPAARIESGEAGRADAPPTATRPGTGDDTPLPYGLAVAATMALLLVGALRRRGRR